MKVFKRESEKGILFILSSPSGGGKTTVARMVRKKMARFEISVSCTTRPPRAGEKHKRDYHFISEKNFRQKVQRGDFLEWARNFGYYYGTPKKEVFDKLKKRIDVLLCIDVKGAVQVKKKYPGCISIFLMPPSMETLSERLRNRKTEHKEALLNRLNIARKEIGYVDRYDYVVVNDKLSKSVKQIVCIITGERCRQRRM